MTTPAIVALYLAALCLIIAAGLVHDAWHGWFLVCCAMCLAWLPLVVGWLR